MSDSSIVGTAAILAGTTFAVGALFIGGVTIVGGGISFAIDSIAQLSDYIHGVIPPKPEYLYIIEILKTDDTKSVLNLTVDHHPTITEIKAGLPENCVITSIRRQYY